MNVAQYRKGAVGALLDLYVRALGEFIQLTESIPPDEFTSVLDAETSDEECRSAATIARHVVRAGYLYADYIKEAFELDGGRPETDPFLQEAAVDKLNGMMAYTLAAVEPMCEYPYERFDDISIKSRWDTVYDFEQLMEHAIVHVLRHHRQIERLQAVKSASA